jgi:hypothetical protein
LSRLSPAKKAPRASPENLNQTRFPRDIDC